VLKLMVVIDEFTRRCLAIHVARRIRSKEALEVFADLMVEHGVPEHIRSDNGPEMVAEELRDWLEHMGSKTAYIMPGSPWENGYCESFNGRMRDELLNGESSGRHRTLAKPLQHQASAQCAGLSTAGT
jgi:transposase InsO family protein